MKSEKLGENSKFREIKDSLEKLSARSTQEKMKTRKRMAFTVIKRYGGIAD
jgi:hypothetical protein